uniref:Uncharacterized protein n=1 Tax=Denticeps clupeoides TaxID=299321 RepID=A0AAY4AMQ8_9TELE
HPPGILNCTAGNVTWSQGTQLTLLITEYEFELQVTKPDKQWMAINSTTLQKGETYKARVRMKPLLKTYHAEWSDWSPECTWVSEVGRSPNVAGRVVLCNWCLLLCSLAKFICCLKCFDVYVICLNLKADEGFSLKKDQQMLDLSKDSQGLHSLQFQVGTPQVYFILIIQMSRDDISPVEVCPAYNTDPYFSCTTKALLYPNDKENINDCRSNGELSGFSNVGYFSEYRPGSIQIYSCPNYFTYHDHRGHQTRDEKGHHSPTGSSSYEQLEHLEKCGHLNSQWLEPLSPDSGVGMEDREEGGHGAPPSAQLEPMWEAAATHISGRLASTTVQPSSSGYLTVKQMQSTYNKSI